MIQQVELFNKIDRLPPEYFDEVFDFIGYLEYKAKQGEYEKATTSENAYKAITKYRGIAKRMGATLTVERFHEMQREELAREIENEERLLGKK